MARLIIDGSFAFDTSWLSMILVVWERLQELFAIRIYMSRRDVWCRLLAVAFAAIAAGQELPPPAQQQVDFKRDIQPLFANRCSSCHGSSVQMNGLRLDRREDALKGGYSGPAIRPGDSAASRLIHLVAGLDEKRVMPPAGPRLSPQEIGLLRAWIDQGAVFPDSQALPQTPRDRTRHWSFRAIARPQPLSTKNTAWVANPIDSFVLARLEKEDVTPSEAASKETLIRRVSLDLTGLLPTPEEIDNFLSDNRPDAYERLVDRLLESPHYGEKWARQWLDLARYADSDGYEKDLVRPHAWRWRHWVIQAINSDMPFDRFTLEQIAGDLLPDAGTDQKVATGFHRNTLTNREGGVNIEQFRTEQVVDRASTVGTVWLGLTFGCAQCHDHKYDPISQKNFYQLYAFFNSADEENIPAPLPGEMGPYLSALPEYRRAREALLAKYKVPEVMPAWEARMREAAANPGKWTDWDHAYDAVQKYMDNGDGILHTPAEKRTQRQTDHITDHFVINYHRVISKERWKELNFTKLRKELNQLASTFPALSEAPMIQERSVPRTSHVLIRGDWKRKGIEVQPGFPAFLHAPPPDKTPNRLTLAKWLVSPDNPLTARVAVNRYWQEFFGRGLVRTSADFGTRGEAPSHPELLDWLAARFIDSGWKVKALHKLIVTSATYRQSSKARPDVDARDPDNALLARQSRLRLPAELVRDAALVASGLLDPTVGGRSVRPPQPAGVAELAYANSVKWVESQGADRYRRGLYIHFQRTVPYPQLINFDAPDANLPACNRERSTTPLQALNLLNDPVFVEAARALAARTLAERSASTLNERIRYLYRLTLGRTPTSAEAEDLAAYFRQQTMLFEKDQAAAERFFPIPLPRVNRVEAAAMTAISSVLLNVDEFIRRE